MHSNFIRKGEKPPLCRPCGSSSVFRFFEDDDEVKTTPSKTPAIVVAWLSYADGKNLLIHKKEARGSWKSSAGPRSPGALRYISGHFEAFFSRKIWYQDVPSSSFLPNSDGVMYRFVGSSVFVLRFKWAKQHAGGREIHSVGAICWIKHCYRSLAYLPV